MKKLEYECYSTVAKMAKFAIFSSHFRRGENGKICHFRLTPKKRKHPKQE
jgi:hypothetical protein